MYTPFVTTEGYNTTLLLETARESPARRLEQPVEIARVFVDIVDDGLSFTTGGVWGAAGGLGL